MFSTKILTKFRQYIPEELCDSDGISYRFQIYKGAGDNEVIPNTPDLGATANVVIRLSNTIPYFKNHIMYFDHFYTSLPFLFIYGAEEFMH